MQGGHNLIPHLKNLSYLRHHLWNSQLISIIILSNLRMDNIELAEGFFAGQGAGLRIAIMGAD